MVGAAAKLPKKPSRNVCQSMDVPSPDKWYNPTVSRLSRPSASQPQPWSETSLPLSVPVTRAEGSLFQVGRSCRQGIGAITQKLDRIELTLASGPCDQVYQALPPGHRPGADRLLDRWPVLFLVRLQLQSKLDELNAPIRKRLELGITEALLRRSSLCRSRALCRSSRNLCIGQRRGRDEEGTQASSDGL